MLSNPQDALFGNLSIVFETICSSTSYNANIQFNLYFKGKLELARLSLINIHV